MKKIMITGATGGLGGEVLSRLSEKVEPAALYALARDPQKLAEYSAKGVHVVQGDYDDSASLVKAFSGIDTLYFVSGSDMVKRGPQHESIVAAAKETGIKHIVYTSFQRKSEAEDSPLGLLAKVHRETEALIKDSGAKYTILKHALYREAVPMFIGQDVIEKGMIYIPAGDGKANFTSRSDMAKAGAEILSTEGHENKTYTIATTEALSFGDIARVLSEFSGKDIQYVSPSIEEFTETLSGAGVPPEAIGMVTMFGEAIRQGELFDKDDTLEKLIGQPESTVDFLKKVYSK